MPCSFFLKKEKRRRANVINVEVGEGAIEANEF